MTTEVDGSRRKEERILMQGN